MKFEDFGLIEPILRAIRAEGYNTPTPIQVQAIPHAIQGRDVFGCAQTGTGKTAAFALPILHRIGQSRPQGHNGASGRVGGRKHAGSERTRPIRALILAPTRELAAQIDESLGSYSRHTSLRHSVVFGGVSQRAQTNALRQGVDVLVATPGRLLDLMQQGYVDLRQIEILVLDEADRMLDMGFIRDIRKIVAQVPTRRQTLLFSATMPADIRELADAIMHRPAYVQVAAVSSPVETIDQSVYFVEKRDKASALKSFLTRNAVARALVFTRTKHGADRLVRGLTRAGIEAESIHGNKSQNARVRAMRKFKSDSPPVLVATDLAARGIDVDEVSHVFNYDLPNVPETYVHRIGRTGRAGASGAAISFCDSQERPLLRDIERLIRRPVPVGPDKPGHTSHSMRTVPPAVSDTAATPATAGAHASSRNADRRSTRGRSAGKRVKHVPEQADRAASEGGSTERTARPPAGVGYRSRGQSRRRGRAMKR